MVRTTVAVRCLGVLASVADTVNVAVPADVGVPLMVPELAPRARPAGSFPADTAQVTGAVPPEEISVEAG